MSKIFISYRRDDTADIVGRIYDHLIQPTGPFPREAVFIDVEAIPLGINFKKILEDKVKECSLALVVIGPRWVDIKNDQQQRRLDDPRDFVRIEVETALKREIPVIPLLVMGASMPDEQQVPSSLAELAYRNGMAIRPDPDFRTDMARLVKSVQRWLESLSEISVVQEQAPVSPKKLDKQSLTTEQVKSESGPYDKLAMWLAEQVESPITLSFAQIEEIIGRKLPPSAFAHREWWANDSVGHSHSKRWLDAGWRTRYPNLTDRVVTFVRMLERQLAYIEFFSSVLQILRTQSNLPIRQAGPTGDNWHIALQIPGARPEIGLTFTYDKRFRIEIYIDVGDRDKNKAAFDTLRLQADNMAAELGLQLSWERIDNKRASRIALYYPKTVSIVSTPEELETLQTWIVTNMASFYNVVCLKIASVLPK
jgi:hypothetical protein